MGFGSIAVVLTGILYALIADRMPWHPYMIWLAAINGATFVMYGLDKFMAPGRGQWRAPEDLLHTLSVAGGFVGAGVGRVFFRHKINRAKHPRFPLWIWIGLIMHVVVLYFLFFRQP
jgi:uncharacterized membrane protein YsdA (DUF1294 family)